MSQKQEFVLLKASKKFISLAISYLADADKRYRPLLTEPVTKLCFVLCDDIALANKEALGSAGRKEKQNEAKSIITSIENYLYVCEGTAVISEKQHADLLRRLGDIDSRLGNWISSDRKREKKQIENFLGGNEKNSKDMEEMEDVSLTLYGVICEKEIIKTAKRKYMAVPDADDICRNDFNRTLKELLILYYQAKEQGMEKERMLLGRKIEGKMENYDFT